MKLDISALLTLKEIRKSLVEDLRKLDEAIDKLEPRTLAEIDKIANERTLGVHDFKRMVTDDEKVKFALQNLGRAGIEDMIKYLLILGEQGEVRKLTAIVKASILNLIGEGVVLEERKNKKTEYRLNVNN